jgi:hypothetical protein
MSALISKLPATWRVGRDADGMSLVIWLGDGDYAVALECSVKGGSRAIVYRGGDANKAFGGGFGTFTFAKSDLDIHETFSRWLDAMVLAQDGAP